MKYHYLKRHALFLIFLIATTSCNPIIKPENIKFDKKKWVTKDDIVYTSRDFMLNDLIDHHQLKGLSYKQLVDSIGEPDNYENKNDSIRYDIVVNYGSLDPKSGKYLVFHLTKDSVVTDFKIVQWHNRHVNE